MVLAQASINIGLLLSRETVWRQSESAELVDREKKYSYSANSLTDQMILTPLPKPRRTQLSRISQGERIKLILPYEYWLSPFTRVSMLDGICEVSRPLGDAWHHHCPAVRVLASVHDHFLTEIDVKYLTWVSTHACTDRLSDWKKARKKRIENFSLWFDSFSFFLSFSRALRLFIFSRFLKRQVICFFLSVISLAGACHTSIRF